MNPEEIDKIFNEIKAEMLTIPEEKFTAIITNVKGIVGPKPVKFGNTERNLYFLVLEVRPLNKTETIEVRLPISEKTVKTKIVHPRSNLYKLMKKLNVRSVADLKGKEVVVKLNERGFYRIEI